MNMDSMALILVCVMSVVVAAVAIVFALLSRRDVKQVEGLMETAITTLGDRWKEDVARRDELLKDEKGRLLAENQLLRGQFLEASRLLSVVKMAGGKVPNVTPRPILDRIAPAGSPIPLKNGRYATAMPPDEVD